jgi:hypothetical protein
LYRGRRNRDGLAVVAKVLRDEFRSRLELARLKQDYALLTTSARQYDSVCRLTPSSPATARIERPQTIVAWQFPKLSSLAAEYWTIRRRCPTAAFTSSRCSRFMPESRPTQRSRHDGQGRGVM